MTPDKKFVRITDLLAGNSDQPGMGPEVRIFGRDEYGNRYTVDVDGVFPYFFVEEYYDIPQRGDVVATQEGYQSYDDKDLQRLEMDQPRDVGQFREQFDRTFEADVPYQRRLAVDENLSGYIKVPEDSGGQTIHISMIDTEVEPDETIDPRIMMLDIETIPPDDMPFQQYVDMAPEEVICFTTYDTYDDEYLVSIIDQDEEIHPPDIKHYVKEHWSGHEDATGFIESKVRFQRHPSEASLLTSFIEEVRDKRPDVVSGWNAVDFDWDYLLRRCGYYDNWNVNQHDLSDNGYVQEWQDTEKMVQGLPAFDMLQAYCNKMTYGQWESKSLDYVAEQVVGAGKVENISIKKEYNRNPAKFLAYNLIDVQLCKGIEDRTGVHEFFYTLTDECSSAITDIWSEMRLVDSYLLSNRTDQEILPTSEEEEVEKISGGLVLTPETGLHDWVGVLDLKSLYPSTIMTCNISPETMTIRKNKTDVVVPNMPLNDENVSGDDITSDDIGWDIHDGAVGFTLEKQGVIPKYIQGLFELRENYKSLMKQTDDPGLEKSYDDQQRSIKVIMNSFFGVLASPYFRLSVEGLAKAITAGSRYVNWSGQRMLKNNGVPVYYSDTDSVFVDLAASKEKWDLEDDGLNFFEDQLRFRSKQLNKHMDNTISDMGLSGEHPFLSDQIHGTDMQAWVWEPEKIYRRMILTAKKRYSGLVFWKDGDPLEEPDLDVVGMASVRSNVPSVGGEVQETVLKKILQGEGYEDVSAYLQPIVDSIRNPTADNRVDFLDIAVPGVLNKPPEEYPNRPCPRAVMYSNEHLEWDFEDGDNPYWVWVSSVSDDKPMTDVIALPWTSDDLPDGFEIDSEKHISKYVKGPLEDILEEMEWDFNQLAQGTLTATLGETNSTENPFK